MTTSPIENTSQELVYSVNDPEWVEKMGYKQAVQANGFIYVSGQVALDDELNLVGEDSMQEQTHQAISNIENILQGFGRDLSSIVKVTTFLANRKPGAYSDYIQAFKERFAGHTPASSAVVVQSLAQRDLLVEIEAVAIADNTKKEN